MIFASEVILILPALGLIFHFYAQFVRKNKSANIKKLFHSYRYQSLIRMIWSDIPTALIRLFKLHFFEKSIQDYFLNIVDETVNYREQNKISRNDFLDLLIALKNNPTIEKFQNKGETEDLENFLAQIGEKGIKCNIGENNFLCEQLTKNVLLICRNFHFRYVQCDISGPMFRFLPWRLRDLFHSVELHDAGIGAEPNRSKQNT